MGPPAPVRLTRLQAALGGANKVVQSRKAPSAVLAEANGRQTICLQAFSHPEGRQVKADSTFPLASISKRITANAMMQLVQDGLLTSDGRLTGHIPEFGQPDKPLAMPSRLLTHSSRIEERGWNHRQTHDIGIDPCSSVARL